VGLYYYAGSFFGEWFLQFFGVGSVVYWSDTFTHSPCRYVGRCPGRDFAEIVARATSHSIISKENLFRYTTSQCHHHPIKNLPLRRHILVLSVSLEQPNRWKTKERNEDGDMGTGGSGPWGDRKRIREHELVGRYSL
jgi:hypothetical protein